MTANGEHGRRPAPRHVDWMSSVPSLYLLSMPMVDRPRPAATPAHDHVVYYHPAIRLDPGPVVLRAQRVNTTRFPSGQATQPASTPRSTAEITALLALPVEVPVNSHLRIVGEGDCRR